MHNERHPLDPVSLIAGVIFVLVALAGLTGLFALVDPRTFAWLLPAALVLVGIAILGSALRAREPADGSGD